MSDLIRRSDAIRAIDEWIQCGTDRDDDIVISEFLSFLKGDINAIPSADRPKSVDLTNVYQTAYDNGYARGKADRPRGEWIEVTNGRGGHECSECHDYAPSFQSGAEYLSHFCPNCGARMKGADDEKGY